MTAYNSKKRPLCKGRPANKKQQAISLLFQFGESIFLFLTEFRLARR